MTEMWGHEEQRAFGEVRRFLAACTDRPRDKALLRRLSSDAHAALHRIEKLYGLPYQEGTREHP